MIKLNHRTFAPLMWIALGAAAFCGVTGRDTDLPKLAAYGPTLTVPLRAEQGAFASAAEGRLQSFERRAAEARKKLAANPPVDRLELEHQLDAFDADVSSTRLAIADATRARDYESFLGDKHRALGKLRLLEGAIDAAEQIG
jgi:hypothetical protein